MTFLQYSMKFLQDNGMFESQAQAVVVQMTQDNHPEGISSRWNDDLEGYPEVMTAVFTMTLKSAALEWIDKNIPKAWYRPIFV